MPIYEYHCGKCERDFEELTLSRSNGDTVVCRHCGSAHVSRVLSAFAVHGGSSDAAPLEPGGCGACGAPRRGMCGE